VPPRAPRRCQPGRLGPVHGRVGAVEHLVEVRPGRRDDHADRRAHGDVPSSGDVHRCREHLGDPSGGVGEAVARDAVGQPRRQVEERDELVTAEAGDQPGPTAPASRRATVTSTSSPARWPKVSLIRLKSSRSTRTATSGRRSVAPTSAAPSRRTSGGSAGR
jgi:hypothetical protein